MDIHQLRLYYHLTKPGIVYANVMTATAGYLLASTWHIKLSVLIGLLGGTALVIASACVFNNVLDIGIDQRMNRTKKRALVTGELTKKNALMYASILGLMGFGLLLLTTWLTFLIGLFALFFYVIVYGAAKRHTPYSTLVGTIPGAASIVAGYTAVSGTLSTGSFLLCIAMITWQMVHFYAIGMYRLRDYAKANVPIWPIKRGIRSTKQQMALFGGMYVIVIALIASIGYDGFVFAVVVDAVAIYWLWMVLQGFWAKDDNVWARQTFFFSLIMLLTFSVMLPFGALLP